MLSFFWTFPAWICFWLPIPPVHLPLSPKISFLHASWEICVLDQICVLLLEAAFLAFTKNSTR